MIEPTRKESPASEIPTGTSAAGTGYGTLLNLLRRDQRVLAFGCAAGHLSRALFEIGCRVVAVEADPLAAAEARVTCDEAIVADLDERALADLLPASLFDVAIFVDVLDRLRDPLRLLEDTRAFLAPDGYVAVWTADSARDDDASLDDGRPHRSSLEAVKDLCARSGFAVEDVEHVAAAREHGASGFVVRARPESANERRPDVSGHAGNARRDGDANGETRLVDDAAPPIDVRERLTELADRNAELEASLAASGEIRERLGTALARIEALILERDELKLRRDELESRTTALERIVAGHAAALDAAMRAADAAEKRALAVRELARAAAADAALVAARLDAAESERARFETIAADERERASALAQQMRDGGFERGAGAERNAASAEATAREKTLAFELRTVAATVVEYAEAELDRLRRDSAAVDAAIRATRTSAVWRVKARLNRALSIAKGLVRRAISERA